MHRNVLGAGNAYPFLPATGINPGGNPGYLAGGSRFYDYFDSNKSPMPPHAAEDRKLYDIRASTAYSFDPPDGVVQAMLRHGFGMATVSQDRVRSTEMPSFSTQTTDKVSAATLLNRFPGFTAGVNQNTLVHLPTPFLGDLVYAIRNQGSQSTVAQRLHLLRQAVKDYLQSTYMYNDDTSSSTDGGDRACLRDATRSKFWREVPHALRSMPCKARSTPTPRFCARSTDFRDPVCSPPAQPMLRRTTEYCALRCTILMRSWTVSS